MCGLYRHSQLTVWVASVTKRGVGDALLKSATSSLKVACTPIDMRACRDRGANNDPDQKKVRPVSHCLCIWQIACQVDWMVRAPQWANPGQ